MSKDRIVFLTSSPTGPFDGTHRMDRLDEKNSFAENVRSCWKKEARCLMIAASSEAFAKNDEMAEFFSEAVRKTGLTMSVFDIWDDRIVDAQSVSLDSYDVIFLGGGHVPTQNRFFLKISLREKLQNFQGMVIGISAGSMNSADIVYAQPELPGEVVDPAYIRFLEGLGLTKTMILPHYQAVREQELDGKRLYEDITYGDSLGKKVLVLPDGSYLLIRDGVQTVWGEAYQIADGEIRKICEDGQHISL